jgi:hypothetical protein
MEEIMAWLMVSGKLMHAYWNLFSLAWEFELGFAWRAGVMRQELRIWSPYG